MAENEIQILIKAVDEATEVLKNIEKQVQTTGKNVEKTTKNTSKAFTKQTDSLLALGNAASSVDNIFDSYQNLQLRLENASERVAGAQDRLSDAQYRLYQVQNNANSSAEDLAKAQRDVESSTRSLTIAQNNQERANNAVIGTYINMGTQSLILIRSLPALIAQVQALSAASLAFAATPWGLATIAVGTTLALAFNSAKKATEEAKKEADEYRKALEALGIATKAVREQPTKEAEAKLLYEIASKQEEAAKLQLALDMAIGGKGPSVPAGTFNRIQQLNDEIKLLQDKYNLEYTLKQNTEQAKAALDAQNLERLKANQDSALSKVIETGTKIIIKEQEFAKQREQNMMMTSTTMTNNWKTTWENIPKITEPQVKEVIRQIDTIPTNKTVYINIVPVYGGGKGGR
jgi:hypothetical protein